MAFSFLVLLVTASLSVQLRWTPSSFRFRVSSVSIETPHIIEWGQESVRSRIVLNWVVMVWQGQERFLSFLVAAELLLRL